MGLILDLRRVYASLQGCLFAGLDDKGERKEETKRKLRWILVKL